MVAITITGTKVYASIVETVLSDSNNTLEETLNFLKSLKLKSYLGKNIAYCCAAILDDADRLDSAGAFKPDNLNYITKVSEDNYDYRFRLLEIHRYKEFMEFI